MNPEIINKIREHYNHAREKHPYFCDNLSYYTKSNAVEKLMLARSFIRYGIENKCVSFLDILNCEIAEAIKEIVDGNTERAIEELLDTIAVCLRGIDVLKGLQVLGNPEKKEGVK
jgi:hypothetical protein